jgi:hypothetical protein
MALNGGVSLAVWMGGCAVELDRARRFETARHEGPRIYDTLCECFDRRLVIDILTGSSAGGINGGLLGAAMVSGRRLDPDFLRSSWLDLGDLTSLLHGSAEQEPRSLMQGKRFHEGLLGAFDCVLGSGGQKIWREACRPETAERSTVPSLDITMTDTIGVERRFRDAWGGVLRAKEHRPRFRFRRRAHYTAEALADATRTSASFPLAFEPWPVKDAARRLAGLPNPTFGIDGGLLDNAPIRAALELIPTRAAGSSVRRYICYMNGDPPAPAGEEATRAEPGLRQIGGYVISLPREAPFVDHLYAIQHAVERPRLYGDTQERLLHMDLDELHGVAEALFDTYRRRRAAQSLEELLPEPGYAGVVDRLLDGTDGRLPWIPDTLDRPREDDWQWGIRPAERILHLLLDTLRPALRKADDDAERAALLESRQRLYEPLADLAAAREAVLDEGLSEYGSEGLESPIDQLDGAVALANEGAATAYAAVKCGARVLHEAMLKHRHCFEEDAVADLFGRHIGSGLGRRALTHFFRRVLSIEVVRRAFGGDADIESAEELHFVQLTPAAPTPVLAAKPFSLPLRLSGERKVTGIGLHHFAAFYRRSWRANDFMWGRLDAAARIVDLLLDAPALDAGRRERQSFEERIRIRSGRLAEAILGAAGPTESEAGDARVDRERLVHEALDDAGAAQPPIKAPREGTLQERLATAIATELIAAGPGASLTRIPFTRAIFQRAAQHEILCEELLVVRRESATDRAGGSAAKPLDLDGLKGSAEAEPEREIAAVREIYADGGSLPGKLNDRAEAVSDMGLRTIVKASLVGLAAARGAKLPMAKFFGYARAPLLAVAGTVATNWLQRLTLAAGIWTAAIYLTARLVSATPGSSTLASVELWPLVTAIVAVTIVLGATAVPGARAARGMKPFLNSVLALLLVTAAGGLATVLAWTAGGLDSIEQILFAPGAETPSNLVVTLPLIAIGALSLARLPVPKLLSPLLKKGLGAVRKSNLLWIPLFASVVPLGLDAGGTLIDAFDGATWQAISAGVALVGAPIAAATTATLWRLRLRPRPQKAQPERG